MGIRRKSESVRVEHVVVPQDGPCADSLRIANALALIDGALRTGAATGDVLLDVRLALAPLPQRPPVPVIPGRAS